MNREQLIKEIFDKKSFLCVGLDIDLNKIPKHLLDEDDPIFVFNKAIIDATAPYCVSYKPNLAFYECYGIKGMIAFEKTINYLKEHYPHHFIIADAKRGDIGNTSRMYAKTFLEYEGKWVILLALTSNKGSQDFQLFTSDNGQRLFERVLSKSQEWGNTDNLMYVVGATQGAMFRDIRKIAPDHFLLVPGVGAQGGSLQEVGKYGMTADCGLLVNSSRGIIYAGQHEDFAEKAADSTKELQQQMAIELSRLQ